MDACGIDVAVVANVIAVIAVVAVVVGVAGAVDRSIDRSFDRSLDRSMDRSINMARSSDRSIDRPTNGAKFSKPSKITKFLNLAFFWNLCLFQFDGRFRNADSWGMWGNLVFSNFSQVWEKSRV